jgi:hypothetical protein
MVENQCKKQHELITGMNTMYELEGFHIIYGIHLLSLNHPDQFSQHCCTPYSLMYSLLNMTTLRSHPDKSGAKYSEMESILTRMTTL